MGNSNSRFTSITSASLDQALYQELAEHLRLAGHQYYTMDSPMMDDAEYDRLYRILQQFETENPLWLLPDSPTQKIGGEILKNFPQVNLDPPMMSLANAADEEAFIEFADRLKKDLKGDFSYHVEPKFDGLAVEIQYEKGQFKLGTTRGNGLVGEGISHNLKTIASIPLQLKGANIPEFLSVRGEVVLSLKEFERINAALAAEDKKLFANPRNAAAGTIRQQDSSIVATRKLAFLPYGFGKWIGDSMPKTQAEFWELLAAFGFFPQPAQHVFGAADVIAQYQKYQDTRSEFPYDIDGLVVKVNEYQHWKTLGSRTKSPRYAIAFKFPSQSATTVLESVEFQVGRTGTVTPVANLRPVNIGGVIVKRATLHNREEIQRLDVIPGDKVEVIRAGDVIPKIVRVVQRGSGQTPVSFPENCPGCGESLVREEVFVRCINPDCEKINLAKLQFAVSKDGLDIDGLGAEWVDKFFNYLNIKDLGDLFQLRLDDLSEMEGMGEVLSAKILDAIEKCKSISIDQFVKSLGIPQVGAYASQLICSHYADMENLSNASIEDLVAIHEIGPGTANSLHEYLQSHRFKALYAKCLQAGVSLQPYIQAKSGTLSGLTFVFTGTLQSLTRDQAANLAKEQGARIASSLSKATSYLVAGAKAGSKMQKAETLGVKVLTEEQYLLMLND